MKKKEILYKGWKEDISNREWTMQREVRRVVQGFIKAVLAVGDEGRDKGELMGLVKGLESGVLAVVRLS